MGQLAFLRPRVAVAREPEREHVHFDRTGRRGRVRLQPDCSPITRLRKTGRSIPQAFYQRDCAYK
jgi:hypothetical protein